MKRVLLIATTTGYQIRSFGEAARTLGVEIVFASDRCDQLEDPWWDHAIPIRFHDESRSMAAIRAAFPDRAPNGILAVGDRPTMLAALAAEAFGLPGNPPEAAAASRNKLASRRAFKAAGLPTPWFQTIPVDRDAYELSRHVPYPAVIKPLALSGSRGVMRADEAGAFVQAFDRLRRLLDAADIRAERDAAHQMTMIESFIPGAEFAVEGVLEHGELRPLAIFDKPDAMDGPFFEETIYLTPPRVSAATQERIIAAVRASIAALGLRHGPIHAECRVDLSNLARGAGPEHSRRPGPSDPAPVYVLEVAAPADWRSLFTGAAVRGPRGWDRVARGGTPAACHGPGRVRLPPRASGVRRDDDPNSGSGIYRCVEGVDDARRVAGVEDIQITAKPDTVLVPLPEGKSYLGFVFARGQNADAVDRALREAHARLQFVIDREIAIV